MSSRFSWRARSAFRFPYLGSVCLCFGMAISSVSAQQKSVPDYAGSIDSSHFSPLTQITKQNVSKLQVAWTYATRDSSGYMFSPLVVGDRMYVLARNTSLVALDAKTGKEVWVHEKLQGISPHGLNYWQSKDGKDKRLIFQMHQQLQEIDATTGKSILTFGTDGFVDLRVGLGRPLGEVFRIQSNNPGRVFENLIIMGSAGGENYMSMPGDFRAFDVVTGKLVWQFHSIPHPGEFGYDTWPKNAYRYIGGANTWGEISVDAKRGIVYFPTASAKYELYGGDRPGKNLYTDCIVAIDARTGKLLWYYQMIHHDIWDWDNVSAPQLVTVKHDGKMVDAVAEAGKTGFLYVFDRVTGKPLWPIEERPVPQTDFPGEKTSPTQPFPTAPPAFGRQTFTADDVDPYILTADQQAAMKVRVAKAKNGPLFTPPGFGDTIEMPGNQGGSNWGTTSSNPSKGLVYVANYDAPAILVMTAEAPGAPVVVANSSGTGNSGLELYSRNCAVCHGPDRTGDIGPSLIDISKRRDVNSIKSVIENGQGQMPSFSSLPDAEVQTIAEYIYSPDLPIVPISGMPRQVAEKAPAADLGGPVVGSGGAPAGQLAPGARMIGAGPYGPMAGLPYPDFVTPKPGTRYYTNWNVMPTIIKPPWTSLVAYDLNKGTILWNVPLGDDPALMPLGIHDTGARGEQRGILTTASGLIFVATSDGKLRAFDDDNGKQIWMTDLPEGNHGIPFIYALDGREYLAVDATYPVVARPTPEDPQPAPPPAPPADRPPPAYVVFALPAKADMTSSVKADIKR